MFYFILQGAAVMQIRRRNTDCVEGIMNRIVEVNWKEVYQHSWNREERLISEGWESKIPNRSWRLDEENNCKALDNDGSSSEW